MPALNIDIGTGFYQSSALPLANQRCVNAFVEVTQAQTPFQNSVFGTPGITQITSLSDSRDDFCRGAATKEGLPYFVSGQSIYRVDRTIDTSGNEVITNVNLGTIEGTERCNFADNGTQLLVLVPSGKGYIVNENSTPVVQEITDPDFTSTNGAPQFVVYIDGYFVVTTDAKKFIVSGINDGLSWSALDFGAALVDPDNIVAPFVFRNDLYVAGSQTIESFENIGGAGFPFQRINGFVIPKGVKAPYSIEVFNNSVHWVGSGESEEIAIWALQGSDAVKVSTNAIDLKLQSLTDEQQKSIFSWSYAEAGHYFIGFTSEKFTLVYDMSTGLWHERESLITNVLGNTETFRCRYNAIVSAYGKTLVGDSLDGRIGVLSGNAYKEYDEVLRMLFTTATIFDNGSPFFIASTEMFLQPGVGNVDVMNPVVNVRVSKDGYTFGDYRTIRMGKVGEYSTRQIERHWGRFPRFAIFEFNISDAVQRRFMGLTINIKQGSGNGR